MNTHSSNSNLDFNESEFKKGNSNRRKTLIILLIVIAFIISNLFSYVYGVSFILGSRGANGIKSISGDIRNYRKFFLVRNIIEGAYNGEIDSEKLYDGAIRGMINSLEDPYTVYKDKKEFQEFTFRSEGNYVGIGIQVAPKDNKIVVVSVFENSPANKVGIRAGDFIIKVSNENVSMDIDQAINLIKGEEGTKVNITIERDGEEISFEVNREKINIQPVEYEKIDEDISYIKINSFDENSSKGVREALEKIGSKGLILDLRGNPGGLLTECVSIASQFLEEGSVIVSTDNKNGISEVLKATKGIGENIEIVVLGDGGSASASEVLIGALRDHNRATFVGSKTFGKGLVQRVFELGDGSGFKVTVSKYYTPNGDYINGVGISPDVNIEYDQNQYIKNRDEANGDKEILIKLDPQYQKALEIIREKIK